MIECSGRTQLSEPDLAERSPQRIDFGHGKVLMIDRQDISEHVDASARPGFSISAT